jgi:TolB-like protein/tetratricopeptide (TPR) repeat protein
MQWFLARLRARKLVHWAVAYLAGAWLLLQVLDLLAQPFAWPTLVLRAATVVLAVGFLAALVLAWYHGERGAQRVSGVELLMLTGILVIAGAAVAFVGGGTRVRPPATPDTAPAAEQGSIAVLPFADMSAERDQEYFADGLTEELLNVLAQLPELRVASRTSAFSFKGSNVAIDSIARALHVANVLEGSVRKDGERLRITAQLIDARNGYHLWSETYDRDVGSMFAVQDEIAHAIVRALELRLAGGRAGATLAREETSDPAAHGLVLQATQLSRMSTRPELERAVELAQEAIARDSSYARAWALLARIYLALGYNGYGDRDALAAQAKSAALRAQALDPGLADAAHALGLLERDHDWDFRAAEAHFSRAIELSPNMAVSYSHRGWLRAQFGRTGEALADAQRAVTLDPLQAGLYTNLASMYVYDGQLQLGIEAYRKALALENNGITLANLALSYAELGQDREAMAAAEQAQALIPEHEFARGTIAYVHARAGRRAEAERYIRMLEAQEIPSHYMIASAYAALGERERALEELEKAMETREGTIGDLGVDPAFATLRGEPRVQAILKKMKLR